MKKVTVLAVSVFLGGLVFALAPTTEVAANEQPDEEQQEEAGTKYDYVAQPGDAFTQIARKAVQTYGIVNDVDLSLAQIVFAETHLTHEAGSPLLVEGEEVTMSEDAVKAAVEKAKNLSDEEQAAWEYYVPSVDFRTDDIGE